MRCCCEGGTRDERWRGIQRPSFAKYVTIHFGKCVVSYLRCEQNALLASNKLASQQHRPQTPTFVSSADSVLMFSCAALSQRAANIDAPFDVSTVPFISWTMTILCGRMHCKTSAGLIPRRIRHKRCLVSWTEFPFAITPCIVHCCTMFSSCLLN